jgi:phosphopantetheine adenylyltransferase
MPAAGKPWGRSDLTEEVHKMPNNVTLEQLEQLVVHLTPPEQIKLIARVSERLSQATSLEESEERSRQDYAAQIEAFLKMAEEMAAESIGEVDAAKDIREMREARMSGL